MDDDRVKLHVVVEQVGHPNAWWEHRVLRTLGTFLLTTVLAGWLGACWQRGHWEEEQAFAARNETAKARLELTSSVTRRISEAFSASNQVVYLTIFTPAGNLRKTNDERLRASIDAWFDRIRQWHVEEMVIIAETKANFSSPQVDALLAKIITNSHTLSKLLTQFIEVSGGRSVPPPGSPQRTELVKINERIYPVVNETTGPGGLLPKLAEMMIQETRTGQERPAGWWWLLF